MRKLIIGGVALLLVVGFSGCAQTNNTININGDNNEVTVQQTAVRPGYSGGYYYPRYYRTVGSYYGSGYGYTITPGYRDGYGYYYRGNRYANGRYYNNTRGTARRTSRRVNRRHH